MTHYFQAVDRPQRSSGHTQGDTEHLYVLACFRHILCFRYSDYSCRALCSYTDSSDTPIATTYITELIWSQFRLWLLRKQHTAWEVV